MNPDLFTEIQSALISLLLLNTLLLCWLQIIAEYELILFESLHRLAYLMAAVGVVKLSEVVFWQLLHS